MHCSDFLPARTFDGEQHAGGKYCVANQTDEMRANCTGMEAVNDTAESTFALFDFISRACSGLSIDSASGVTQMIFNHDVNQPGRFNGRESECKDKDACRRTQQTSGKGR